MALMYAGFPEKMC